MNVEQIFLMAGGIFSLSIAIFHLTFWRLFRWQEELPRLSVLNQGVMQVLNIQLTLMIAVLGFVSLGFSKELSSTALGQVFVWSMVLFWLARAVQQPIFWGLKSRVSQVFLLLFCLGAILYLFPALA
jgi:hypothetical protein